MRQIQFKPKIQHPNNNEWQTIDNERDEVMNRTYKPLVSGKKPNNNEWQTLNNERDGVMNETYEPLVSKRWTTTNRCRLSENWHWSFKRDCDCEQARA